MDAWAGVFTFDRSDSPLLLFALAGFTVIAFGDFAKICIEHKE